LNSKPTEEVQLFREEEFVVYSGVWDKNIED
jgi:hypothetical protein